MNYFRYLFQTGKGGFACGFLSTLLLILIWNYADFKSSTHRISETKAAGLASLSNRAPVWSHQALWRQPQIMNALFPRVVASSHFDHYGYADQRIVGLEQSKKILRKAQIEMTAPGPLEAMNAIRDIATTSGGVVDSASSQDASEPYARADIAIRIPAAEIDRALEQIRKVATQITSDHVDAVDVTKQYSDEEAQIRNLQAQEKQYLKILGATKQVSEVLEVTEKLDAVRASIDTSKADLWTLEHDIAMSAVKVSIRRDSATARFYNWRPVQQIRESASSTVQGMISLFNGIVAMVFYIPVILLWLLVIAVVSIVIVRWIRFVWKRISPMYGALSRAKE